ncbi:LysM peptidoglycan-binding domain-containing protein [Flavobacterium gyeonganense]|uniref:LysM peptidoglycan-binding domain-containing protein n=1 Tax=Flavobacterium gyeonganense TaxID=1310418 RepID=A0ABV5HFG2_9FLAO|nr:LysM peptidoglycan-binding domain-containing protein [Flavobacterium gyeonganense]
MYYIEEAEVSFHGRHRTYKVKKGDTLESVSLELGIAASELRRYHNIYCEIPDLIEADFKRHLEFLILAPEKSEAEILEAEVKTKQKVSLGKEYKLPFLPQEISKEYKVQYTTEVGDQIDTIEMEVGVKWLASDKNKFHLFEIRRQSIHINNEIPDTVMDELAAKTAEVLYPLEIVVDESGKWIDVHNYSEIINRWEGVKTEILDYYEGEVIQIYIDHTECALENIDTLLKSLASDYFLRVFFNAIHIGYTANYEFKNNVSFPLEKDEESLFEVEQKIDPFLDESYLVKVEQKGDYKDSESEANFGYDPRKGYYNATYLLDKDSYWIEKIKMECSIDYDDLIKISISVESLEKQKELN